MGDTGDIQELFQVGTFRIGTTLVKSYNQRNKNAKKLCRPGKYLTIFHESETPCGHIRDIQELLQGGTVSRKLHLMAKLLIVEYFIIKNIKHQRTYLGQIQRDTGDIQELFQVGTLRIGTTLVKSHNHRNENAKNVADLENT